MWEFFWNNHHHMMHATGHIDGRVPVGETCSCCSWLFPYSVRDPLDRRGRPGGAWPVAAYGVVLLMAGGRLLAPASAPSFGAQGPQLRTRGGAWQRPQGQIINRDLRGIYSACVSSAMDIDPRLYVVVALIWLVPDRRIESAVK